MAIDPRLLALAQMRQQQQQQLAAPSRGVQVGPTTLLRMRAAQQAQQGQMQQAQQARASAPMLGQAVASQRAKSSPAQAAAPDEGGFRGLIGGIMSNPLVRTALKPLEILDAPRRVVTSALQEGVDAINGGDASWGDFTEQIGDPNFGFGDVVGETGNKWLDRAIGFAGDIALDPTTYLTVGTSKFIGSAGRAALAGEAAAKGLGEEVLQRIGRGGEHLLTQAERDVIGLGKPGMRWGIGAHNVRLPGTGGLSTGIGKTLGAARGTLTATPIGSAARRMGGSRAKTLRPFVEKIATGEGDISYKGAAAAYGALTNRAGAETGFVTSHAPSVKKAADQLRGRTDVARAATKPGAPMTPELQLLRDTTDLLFDSAQAEGVKGLHYARDYFPRYQTDVLKNFMGNDETNIIVDAAGMSTGRLDPRKWTAGSTVKIKDKKITFGDASIDDIEEKLWDTFPELKGQKLLEDDPAEGLSRLTLDYSRDVGRAKMELALEAGGVLGDQKALSRQVASPEMTKARNKTERDLAIAQRDTLKADRKRMLGDIDAALKGVAPAARKAAQGHVDVAKAAQQAIEGRVEVLDRITEDIVRRQGELTTAQAKTLADAEQRLTQLATKMGAIPEAIKAEKGKVFKTRWQGYPSRAARVEAEQRGLEETAMRGGLAAQEARELGPAYARTKARHGKLVRAGAEIPSVAEFEAEAGRILEDAQNRLYEAEFANLPEMRAEAAEARLPTDILPEAKLSRELAKMQPGARQTKVAKAVTELGGFKKTGGLAPGDVRAARHSLTLQQLSDPEILSDAVINANPPELVQHFYDLQLRLKEALKPYEAMDLAEEVPDALPTGPLTPTGEPIPSKTAVENAMQRRVLEKEISGLQNLRRRTRLTGGVGKDELFWERHASNERLKVLGQMREELGDRRQLVFDTRTGMGSDANAPFKRELQDVQDRIKDLQDEAERTWSQMPAATKKKVRDKTRMLDPQDQADLQALLARREELGAQNDLVTTRQRRWVDSMISIEEARLRDLQRPNRKLEAVPRETVPDPNAATRTRLTADIERTREALARPGKEPPTRQQVTAWRTKLDKTDPETDAYRQLQYRIDQAAEPGRARQRLEAQLAQQQRQLDDLPPVPENVGEDIVPMRERMLEDPHADEADFLRRYIGEQQSELSAEGAKEGTRLINDEARALYPEWARLKGVIEQTKQMGNPVPYPVRERYEELTSQLQDLKRQLDVAPTTRVTTRSKDQIEHQIMLAQQRLEDLGPLPSVIEEAPVRQRYSEEGARFGVRRDVPAGLDARLTELHDQVAALRQLTPVEKTSIEGLETQVTNVDGRMTQLKFDQEQLLDDTVRQIEEQEKRAIAARQNGQWDVAREAMAEGRKLDARMQTSIRTDELMRSQLVNEKSRLTNEIRTYKAEALPNRVAELDDATVQELGDEAARVAEAMARTAAGERQTGAGEGVNVLATRQQLINERDEVAKRMDYRERAIQRRAPLEPTEDDIPVDIEELVDASWKRHIGEWERARAMKPEELELPKKLSKRQFMAERRAAFVRENPEEAARLEKMVNATGAQRKAQAGETAEQLEKAWQNYVSNHERQQAHVRRVRDLRKNKRRPGEKAFRQRRREELIAQHKRERVVTDDTRELALDMELEDVIVQKSREVHDARREENRFKGMLRRGELPAHKDEMVRIGGERMKLQRNVGTLAESGLEGDFGAESVMTQLYRRRRDAEYSFEGFLKDLVGHTNVKNPMGFVSRKGRASKVWKRGALSEAGVDAQKVEHLLSLMTPAKRERFRLHVMSQQRADRRRLADLTERIERLDPTAVTDDWMKVLTDSPDSLKARPRGEARDLTQLIDPELRAADIAKLTGHREARVAARAGAKKAGAAGVQEARTAIGRGYGALFGAGEERAAREAANFAERLPSARLRDEQATRLRELAGGVEEGEAATAALAGYNPEARLAEELAADIAPGQAVIGQLEREQGTLGQLASVQQRAIRAMPERFQREMMPLVNLNDAVQVKGYDQLTELYKADEMVANAQDVVARSKNLKTPARKEQTGNAARAQIIEYQKALKAEGMPVEATAQLGAAAMVTPHVDDVDFRLLSTERRIKDIENGKLPEVMITALQDGYQVMKSGVQGRDLAIDTKTAKMIATIEDKIRNEPTGMGKALDAYTQLFKSYATMSPGFHFRNAVAATFMNGSDDVSFANMGRGVKIANAYYRNPTGEWWKHPSIAKYGDEAREAMKMVFNSGAGGQFSVAEVGQEAFARTGRVNRALTRNRAVRGSKHIGERTEVAVRAGMAIDSALKKQSLGEGTTRINRIHFNYSQASEWDQQMRRLVPFWTFLSRNVPLQVQQMWTHPRAYLHYQSFKRNFTDEGQDQSLLPKYIREAGGFSVGGGLALMPDIGGEQLESTVNQLTGPRIMSQFTPGLKVPLQLATNRNFFYDEPYRENDFQPVPAELGPLAPILSMLGMTQEIPGGGGLAIERKNADAVRDLIPMLATINRLGGTTPNRENLTGQSWMNWLGIPIKDVGPEVLANEQRRRQGAAKGAQSDERARARALAALARTG